VVAGGSEAFVLDGHGVARCRFKVCAHSREAVARRRASAGNGRGRESDGIFDARRPVLTVAPSIPARHASNNTSGRHASNNTSAARWNHLDLV
jgi:hypothetical protein